MQNKLYPFHISTEFDPERRTLRIENKTQGDWKGIAISLQDGYAQNLCQGMYDFKSMSTREIHLVSNLPFYHLENGIRLRLFKNGLTIYDRILNLPRKRAFILYSNKNFEELAKCAIEGIRNFSELDVYYYTIGFETDLKMKNVFCRKHEINASAEECNESQYMQMVKPEIFLRALEEGLEDCLFLDTDVQVRPNIEEMFTRFSHVNLETPVLNRNYWQFLFVGDKYIPEEALSKKMGYVREGQFQGHGVTNIFLFRKEMRGLIEKWNYWCKEDEILNRIRKENYLHDEVIFNLLCWVEEVKQMQGNLLFNVQNLKEVKVFDTFRADEGQSYLDFNSIGCGHYSQSFAPYETDDVVGFHCVKDPKMAKSINEYIKSNCLA